MLPRALGWMLVIVSALFTIVAAIAYIVTGTFDQGWSYASAAVYGTIVILAIAFLVLDRRQAPAPVAPAPHEGPAVLTSREEIYRTRAGSAWKLSYARRDGGTEIRYMAAASGQMLAHHEVATYIDALPTPRRVSIDERLLQRTLDRHALPLTPSNTKEEGSE